jgi:hypothetical protein
MKSDFAHMSANVGGRTGSCQSQLAQPDGMRRPVSERDAVRSQVIDVLEAQEIKETGDEED